MPLFIFILFVEFISVLLLFIDYKLWRQWHEFRNSASADYANWCLYGAIALLAYILSGRHVIMLLLSNWKRKEPGPEVFRSAKPVSLKRPDGSKIYFEEFGNPYGQPIIFVHGWNANRTAWYYQRKYFEKKYRIIFLDLPGLGRSTRPDNKDYALSKLARDVNAVIEYTGAKNPVLWGHSIGGMTILSLVTKEKEILKGKISALILQHTTYTNPLKTAIFSKFLMAIQKPVLAPVCYLMIALSPIFWLINWFSFLNGNTHIITRLLAFTGTQSPRQLNYVSLLFTLASPAVIARGVLGMFAYDVTNNLPEIDIPTLIISADKDRLTKPEASKYMHTHIPGAKLITVEPAGHHGIIERHKEVNEAAADFLQAVFLEERSEVLAVNRES